MFRHLLSLLALAFGVVGVVDCPVVGVECFSLREWVVHKAFFDVPKVMVEKMNISVHVVSPMARNKNPIIQL